MRILLADDHDLVRETLADFIARDDGFETREAMDLEQVIALIEAEGPFDLVLLDYRMPGMRGLAGLERVCILNGGKPVALMSGTLDRHLPQAALNAGAAGFLPKTLSSKSLLNAVRFMLSGERFVPARYVDERQAAGSGAPAPKLTEREIQVLDGLCEGLANKEIARKLNLHEVTVKLHVKSLCRKLNARNRTQAALVARDLAIL